MTILDLLKTSAGLLTSHGISNPKTSCEILLSYILGVKRLDLYLNYDQNLIECDLKRFKELLQRRAQHEPLQYIIGKAEFMSLPFTVNAHVLIPRPETELLVEEVIAFCKSNLLNSSINTWHTTMKSSLNSQGGNSRSLRILDIGAGCGNIAVSLAYYLPGAEVMGIDISSEAIDVAKKNAICNNVGQSTDFTVKDIIEARENDYSGLHVVVSNPPYVTAEEKCILAKEVIDFEPHGALFSGGDGFLFYHAIVRLSRAWLSDGGLLAFETGYSNGEQVKNIVINAGFHNVCLSKDYAQFDRIVTGIK